jgi:hypothetical protein
MLHRLAAMIGEELEIDLDLQVDEVETTASGSISTIDLTTSLGDAATIFNCNAAVSLTGELEALRNHTAALRPAEWGLLLYRLIGFLDVARAKEEDIYLSIFRELQKRDLIREAMVRGLDQQRLKKTLYGDFPLSMDEGRHNCTESGRRKGVHRVGHQRHVVGDPSYHRGDGVICSLR